jgi:SNF2 family DNA or RNA helicase
VSARKELQQVESELAIQAVRRELRYAATDAEREAILETARAHTGALRQRLAKIKAPAIADVIAAMLEDGVAKLVVFAWHREMIDGLLGRLGPGIEAAKIDGSTSDRVRQSILHRFQNERSPRVVICQESSGGEAIALHASHKALFAETSWSLGSILQAAKRIVSADQQEQKEIIACSVPDSIDYDVNQTILRKAPHAEVFNSLGG